MKRDETIENGLRILLRNGVTRDDVAAIMGVSKRTLERHFCDILKEFSFSCGKLNAEQIRKAGKLASYGVPIDLIAKRIGTDAQVLESEYGEEIRLKSWDQLSQIAARYIQLALDGDAKASEFILSKRMGWKAGKTIDDESTQIIR